MTTLVEWLRDALDTHERIARAAKGVRWQWVYNETDEVLTPDLDQEFLHARHSRGHEVVTRIDLRSVEHIEHPASTGYGSLPVAWAFSGAEEVAPASALLITMNDPAHVLRTVQAHREILDRHSPIDAKAWSGPLACRWCFESDPWPCPDVRSLAAIYRDHPGFDPSWIGES